MSTAPLLVPDTPKGRRTRARILRAALASFAARGYDATTLRDIAREAGCSLGLAYRYFAGKEDMVLAVYADLAAEFDRRVSRLPAGPLGERFQATMRAKLRLLAPHRESLGGLAAAALTPGSAVGVLGRRAAPVRERGIAAFRGLAAGSANVPPRAAGPLAVVLFTIHLGLILFWLHDRSPRQAWTREVIAFARRALDLAAPLLGLPPAAAGLARLGRSLEGVFGGRPSAAA